MVNRMFTGMVTGRREHNWPYHQYVSRFDVISATELQTPSSPYADTNTLLDNLPIVYILLSQVKYAEACVRVSQQQFKCHRILLLEIVIKFIIIFIICLI